MVEPAALGAVTLGILPHTQSVTSQSSVCTLLKKKRKLEKAGCEKYLRIRILGNHFSNILLHSVDYGFHYSVYEKYFCDFCQTMSWKVNELCFRSHNVHRLVLTWIGVIFQFIWRLGTITSRYLLLPDIFGL